LNKTAQKKGEKKERCRMDLRERRKEEMRRKVKGRVG
jgi:hypothetical protein